MGNPGYHASVAQWKAELAQKRPKPAKLVDESETSRLRRREAVGPNQPTKWNGRRWAATSVL